jgi:surface protein
MKLKIKKNEFEDMKDGYGTIENWNVSNVQNMSHLFCYCFKFNKDISKWNVSNVTNMSQMFHGCKNFNQDISNWNVSYVTDMSGIFCFCENFNQDLSKWNKFKDYHKLTTIPNWSTT